MTDVQALVDALAAGLKRPVGVDDRQFRAVAYSSHIEHVDSVRVASILHREAPREVTAWLESLGISEAQGVVRVPANARLGMAARVCVPIRFDGTLLGYLWLIDEPHPLSSAELDESLRYADDLGIALYRARRLEHQDRERERELVAQLLGRRDGGPAAAAAELLRGGFLPAAPCYAVLVLSAFRAPGEQTPDAVRIRLANAAEHVRRAVAPHHLLVLLTGEQAVSVLACGSTREHQLRAAALAAVAEQNLGDTPGWSVLVGVGAEQTIAGELCRAYEQALEALHVARAIGWPEPVVPWSGLGAYRTVASLLGRRDPRTLLPSSIQRLLACSDASALVRTLESYLDLAGDARAAAEVLHLHRSSLYGRLHRIEEIAGVNLRSGEDRLELHLAVRLWRLGGGALPSGRDNRRARGPEHATAVRGSGAVSGIRSPDDASIH